MPYNNLNILVLLREVNDPRPPARVITRGAAIDDRGIRRMPNPADLSALEEALILKERLGATVTALAIGPARVDDTLRLAVAMGADRAIRFWDHGLDGGDAATDARILTRFLTVLAPKLVFTGNRLLDCGDDPVPAMAAAAAGTPAVSAVLSLILKGGTAEALRKGDRGGRQVVNAPLPCTMLFEGVREPRYPTLEAVTRSLGAAIEEWELTDLGLPFWEVGGSGALLTLAEFGTPRPDPVRVVTPDATLPAYERILSLLSGGIKAREGKMHFVPAGDAADELWRIFGEEGLVPDPT